MTKCKVHSADASLGVEPSINPKTGRVWSLADPEVEKRVTQVRNKLQNPEKAAEFLKSAGILNSRGRLAKGYGG